MRKSLTLCTIVMLSLVMVSCNNADSSSWSDLTASLMVVAQQENFAVPGNFIRLDKNKKYFIHAWWDDTLMFKYKRLTEVKKHQKHWIKKEGCEAYYDTLRSLLDPAMMAIHRKAWQIAEVNCRGSAKPGEHMVVTLISKDDRPGWYRVEVRRYYIDGRLSASWPIPYLSVHESNDSVIVNDLTRGDLSLEEWRRLETNAQVAGMVCVDNIYVCNRSGF